ncbi:E3 ubiquitin-protein ligase TTC3 isoform X2 [Melanotaenia boesemani]|uniref:E3 ubiquitin-protein ligase TTC3 isoform X2 n=1 Tax=Melanotaenia boesemani TaxID=1250792 RepID=UPI001C043609|nr:E3 ubiquitin-protein ligase TTC3 isoform X2 [Melanotaenia boesemani]
MSDSDSDCGGDRENRKRRKRTKERLITFRPSEEIFERWDCIPIATKTEAAQRMKICAFWIPILLQQEESCTADWAMEIGLISSRNSEELKIKHLHRIEIVEAILYDLEQGTLNKDRTRHVIAISNMFNLRSPEVFDNALRWLEGSGDHNVRDHLRNFGTIPACFTALHLIFTEFAKFIQDMGANMKRTMKALYALPDDYLIEKSEEMKKKGNEYFQKEKYDEAVRFYSEAIKHYPDNHILYGNRAQCYLRCEKYLKAVGDGKRAILIDPFWAKGHYRFCEALFSLGEIPLAFKANCSAKSLCRDDQDGLKVLDQQYQKFLGILSSSKAEQSKKMHSFNAGMVRKRPQSSKAAAKTESAASATTKNTENKMDKKSGKNEKAAQAEVNAKDTKPSKSEKAESNASTKKKTRSRNGQTDEEKRATSGKADVCKELRFMVQEAFTALYDLRSRNAEQAFSQALALLETVVPKDLGLSTLDVLMLLFGRASALIEIGQPEELAEAQKVLDKMKSYEERTFQCLVYYAIGRVYFRENRFAVALQQFSDSQQMVKNQITPGKLTWPLTKHIVKETEPEYFKEILESYVELCRFPPVPDAVCRLEICLCPLKAEIYFTDPDFKGYVQVSCCQSCRVEFHVSCWKTLKATTFCEKSEKDILREACLTPDCVGQICCIKIFGPTGLVKCKFETEITKPQTPKKPKVNQKCTSVKKLKSKEERKLQRKHHKQSFQDEQIISDEIVQLKDSSGSQSQHKAWLVYRDRVLLQISQNMNLLKEEKTLHISALTSSLKPWLQLDLLKGNQLAGRLLNWQEEPLESFGQAVELLLERKNRVWARVFIQLLSSRVDVNPKLSSWAGQLNNAGLNAAQTFIERYAGHLEQLDLAVLLNFEPLQEMIIEKLDTRPEVFASIGLTVTEYLKQAPPHDMRLFIWTLEEHRDDYVSCHSILDEYFDMMDGHCSVLKKSDENENNSPIRGKTRGRKKRHREQKGPIVFSGMRAVTTREEWDQDFFEDDSLSFLHPVDPFTVPSHLRDQVADFEDQYSSTRQRTHYKKILDNNPDPTKETLYDYFAQILEEHGPLMASDPLLVGELEHFPAVARQKFEEAGGFEVFLLESLRFIKMGRRIGLAKHAVCMQQAAHGTSLDDLDEIADPEHYFSSPNLHGDFPADLTSCLENYPSAQTEINPILPNPFWSSGNDDILLHWTNGFMDQAAHFLPNGYEELDLDNFEVDDGVLETDSASSRVASGTPEEIVLRRNVSMQTFKETLRSVAVNSELHERFEKCQGDINKMERSIKKLDQQIKKMAKGCDKVTLNSREDIILLEDDIKKITTNIQVTNKELMMFQQKLEEEVKKDQKEKKANQEVLKSLKTEIEQLLDEQASLTRNIREKKTSYEVKLRDFLELSNQSAAEKMSLEDEIKRCKSLLTSATRRSHTAQLSVVESSRDQGLYGLYRELADTKALLTKLDEVVHRFPNPDLEIRRSSCKAKVEELERNISAAEKHYKEQADQVKNGSRVCELPPASSSSQSEPAAPALSVAAKEFMPQPAARATPSPPPPVQHSAPPAAEASAAPPQMQHRPAVRKQEPAHSTVFEKAMEALTSMFPDYTRSDLMKYVQELRSSKGGSLSSMALQDVVGGVTQLILDHQERLSSARAKVAGHRSPAQRATPPLVNSAPVWQPLGPQRARNPNALNVEDPCIICHEDMSPDETCVLECRHGFHHECIRSWLREQNTCPTCRNHALLPEEFPALSGRRRQAP